MRTEVIFAYSIDTAVGQILEQLKEDIGGSSSGRHNVIYFDGWDGLGASAVLREVGRHLASEEKKPALAAAGLEFSQIIHIDCSKWESRRALQKALVEQLKLPSLEKVKEVFAAQDEEDDYNGMGKGSRTEIPQVAGEIYQHIQKQLMSRFLVIFNNGSCEEIDLESFGFPLSGYSRNKALWTFQGGFRLYPRMKVDMALENKRASSTDVFLSATSGNLNENTFSNIMRHEAEEVALGLINAGGIDWTAVAASCFLYTMRLSGMGGHLIDYDLATHGCNYWICDGIIQLQQGDVVSTDDGTAAADILWLSCDALKREMHLDADYHQSPQLPTSPVVRRLQGRVAYWTSPTYGSTLIKDQRGRIPKGMFQQYDNLCVLKLSACTFSLASPPFVCCHSLRFLWLDHCREEERFLWLDHCREEESSSTDDGAASEDDIRRCFQKLWVLDVRYSSSKFLSEKMMDFMAQLRELHVMGQEEFDMDTLQGRLHNIRKLRVTKSKTNTSKRPYLLSGKDKMEHLELSGNGGSMKSLSVEGSSCSSLETVIVDGCVSLEEISLKGWAKPKNLLLSGSFPDLYSLDLTGAAVETVDLSAVMAPKLDELLLIDCVRLTAILWPRASAPAAAGEGKGSGKRYLSKLRIDTTQKLEDDIRSSTSHAGFNWYICVRDARLLRWLEPVKDYFADNEVHLDISTRMPSCKDIGSRLQAEVDQDNYYAAKADVAATVIQQQQADDSAIMSTCPPAPGVSSRGCYMHIEDTIDATAAVGTNEITIPGFICDGVKILHVHDSMFVTRIVPPADSKSKWDKLEWCRVERCPKLEYVFSGIIDAFGKLRTIWVAHLTNARCIIGMGHGDPPSFQGLTLLHFYCCPRLAHALLWEPGAFERLEILQIMWCGDLNMVFMKPFWLDPRQLRLELPKLKHLHLHELPELYGIVAPRLYKQITMRIYAPNLETVKIRGCWNLRQLPVVGQNKVASCDCEKEWWDKLEWVSELHPSNYLPIHSQHYKKTMIRGSLLR